MAISTGKLDILNSRRQFDEILSKTTSKALYNPQIASLNRLAMSKQLHSLGDLKEIADWFFRWHGQSNAEIDNSRCVVFGGTHGITKYGVSGLTNDQFLSLIEAIQTGDSLVNRLCRTVDLDFEFVPIKTDQATADITKSPAMTEAECIDALNVGISSVPKNICVLVLGEVGAGNTTSASSISFALGGGEASDWVGYGAGISGDTLDAKTEVVSAAVETHKDYLLSSFDYLQRLAGREMAAIAGAVLAARIYGIPVLLDGFVSTAAVAPLVLNNTQVLDHTYVGHNSSERGHSPLLKFLNKEALLNWNMGHGEASGAVLAFGLLKSIVGSLSPQG